MLHGGKPPGGYGDYDEIGVLQGFRFIRSGADGTARSLVRYHFLAESLNHFHWARNNILKHDVAAFQRPFVDLGDTLLAKSMDDRIGCAILTETLRRLDSSPHTLHFVFTVQEEMHLQGATTAAYKVHPDISIAVDITDSGDIPERKHFEVKMGDGPAIKVMDRGMLAHPGLKRWMIATAEAHNIPYQLEILNFGTTEEGIWTAWADFRDSSGQTYRTASSVWEVAWHPVHGRP